MIAKTPQTLLEFFEQHFEPTRLANRSLATIQGYRQTVNMFQKSLERSPLLEDLQTDNLMRLRDYLSARNYGAHTIAVRTCHLRALWREAFERGFVTAQPPAPRTSQQPDERRPRKRKPHNPADKIKLPDSPPPELTSDSPLIDVFWNFAHARLKDRHPKTAENYRRAINRFRDHLRRPPLVDDLTDENLETLTEWMVRGNYSGFSIDAVRSNLRAIWHHACRQGVKSDMPAGSLRPMNERPEPLEDISSALQVHRVHLERQQTEENGNGHAATPISGAVNGVGRFIKRLARLAEPPAKPPIMLPDVEQIDPAPFDDGWDGRPALQPAPTMTLGEYLEKVYSQRRLLKPKSICQYQAAVNSISGWHGKPLAVRDLSRDFVNSWIRHLIAGPNAPATVQNRRRHLLTLWIAADRDGLVNYRKGDTLTVPAPWVPPRAWTWEQVKKLLDAAERLQGDYPAIQWLVDERNRMRRATYWGIVIRMAWDTGLRGCDLLELTPGMLANDRTIELTQSKTSRWHIVKVHEETELRIRASFSTDRATIIPRLLSPEYFRKQFRAIIEAAGLRGSFKTLRKSSATDVEIRHPGCGAAHLGHVIPGDIAHKNYLDPKLLIENRPMPRPLRTLPAGIESKGAG